MGEDHEKTADSYHELGITQVILGNIISATESVKQALNIRQKVSGEIHEKTTGSYHEQGVTQYMLRGYTSAAESCKQALNIRQKGVG